MSTELISESLNSIWESNPEDFQIVESEDGSEVDGKVILARVVGPAFFPDTTSGNKVHYPRKAWENALSNKEFQDRLNDRLVFGTIGHDPTLDDNDIRKGNFSHIVTKTWIDPADNKGKAEYLVLNTPPGQILNTIFRAGSKIKVSTKAKGKTESSLKSGEKKVDPDNFQLERIDFVINPGYKQAEPSLVESQLSTNPSNEVSQMSDENKVTSILEAQIKELSESRKINEEQARKLQNELRTLSESHVKLRTNLELYESLGTLSDLQESMKSLSAYKVIGTPAEITEALEKSESVLESLSNQVKHLTSVLEKKMKETGDDDDDVPDPDDPDEKLGTKKQIKEALEAARNLTKMISEYQQLGTAAELTEALNVLESYIPLGTAAEISAVFDEAKKIIREVEDKKISELAKKHECEEDAVRKMIDSGMSLDDADDVLGKVRGKTESKKKPVRESLSTDSIRSSSVNNGKPINESLGMFRPDSLAARLLSRR